MNIDNDDFYCYVRGDGLRRFLSERGVLDELLRAFKVDAHGKRSHLVTTDDKLSAIIDAIAHLTTAKARGFAGVTPAEILAAFVWRTWKETRRGKEMFHVVADEKELKDPVSRWLRNNGYGSTYVEIPMNVSRADVIGIRVKDGIGAKLAFALTKKDDALVDVAAVELKNRYAEWGKAEKQMSDYRDFARYVYFACTPAFAADYLDRVARATKQWNALALHEKLARHGYGFLLVMGRNVEELLPAQRGTPRDTAAFLKMLDGMMVRATKKR